MPTSSVRRSNVLACAAEDVRAELEAKLKEAVAREDYKAAAALKAELDAAPVPVKKLYASLQQRASQLSSRRELCVQEREHIRGLADAWPAHELAQQSLWEHWFGEYGDEARKRLVAAEGEAAQLESLVDEFPDWVEPANRLATLRYIEGDYHDSIALCLKILRQKPWHFGAGSGIVMCYAKVGEMQKAKEWAAAAMPKPGPERTEWVERMVAAIDAKLGELDEIDEISGR